MFQVSRPPIEPILLDTSCSADVHFVHVPVRAHNRHAPVAMFLALGKVYGPRHPNVTANVTTPSELVFQDGGSGKECDGNPQREAGANECCWVRFCRAHSETESRLLRGHRRAVS